MGANYSSDDGEQGAAHLRKNEDEGHSRRANLCREDSCTNGNGLLQVSIITIIHKSTLTVAKNGPEKKPRKLIATDAAMMFGTLLTGQRRVIPTVRGTRYLQPKHKLEGETQHAIHHNHASLPQSMRRLR